MTATMRFDAETHTYFHADRILPSITQMLDLEGLIDKRWYTEEARERGARVHALTAAFDLGALDDVAAVHDEDRGYLRAHINAMKTLRCRWVEVEEPRVSPELGFGGRPDRVGYLFGADTVLDLKTGEVEPWHDVQTALQVILVSSAPRTQSKDATQRFWKMPRWQRFGLILRPDGRFKLREHTKPRDFDKARAILRRWGRP